MSREYGGLEAASRAARGRGTATRLVTQCRGIRIRWDHHADTYLGLLKLACALLWSRRYTRLTTCDAFLGLDSEGGGSHSRPMLPI